MVKKVKQTNVSGIMNAPKAGIKQSTSTKPAQKVSGKRVKASKLPAGGGMS